MTKNKRKRPSRHLEPPTDESDEESSSGEDMMDMLEDNELEYMKKSVTSGTYKNLYDKVKGVYEPKPKRRKVAVDDGTFERRYEENIEDDSVEDPRPVKAALPLKSGKDLIPQTKVNNEPEENLDNIATEDSESEGESQKSEIDFEQDFDFATPDLDLSKPLSNVELLVMWNETLKQKKLHIGTLSAGFLENPEEKITNLRTLIGLMDERPNKNHKRNKNNNEDATTAPAHHSIRKLAMVSLLEVFKDVLPAYEIKRINQEGVKLKKDTLKLQKYEDSLVMYYKKYLMKLNKLSSVLIRKKKKNKANFDEDELLLGEMAVDSMCQLLVTNMYFNFAPDIAEVVVPYLSSSRKNVRETVKNCFKRIFKEDKKEELTLKILRLINNHLKNNARKVNTDTLEILLVLNLKDANLDVEREREQTEKKLKAKKMKLLEMSKKEKKRKKLLEHLEKEMLETKAEENRQAKHQNLTEITKVVFNIYFRVLKTSSDTKVLGVCLEGLAKFAHCINVDFYLDIVNCLDKLMKEDWIGYREQLNCIQTVFSILSGQGEALNIDPTRFYVALYKNLLVGGTNCAAKDYEENFAKVVRILNEALVKRRKKITNNRAAGFLKRLATLSLQLLPNGTLACLCLIKNSIQLNRSLDILLDLDSSVGDGRFDAEVEDPEYANALNTSLNELLLLATHNHPVVRMFAKHIMHGMPVTGEHALPPEYAHCSPEDLFRKFSMAEMAFNPPVPAPNHTAKKETATFKKPRTKKSSNST